MKVPTEKYIDSGTANIAGLSRHIFGAISDADSTHKQQARSATPCKSSRNTEAKNAGAKWTLELPNSWHKRHSLPLDLLDARLWLRALAVPPIPQYDQALRIRFVFCEVKFALRE